MRAWLAENLTGEFAGLRGGRARAASTRRSPSGWPGTGSWPRRAGPASAGRPSTAAATPRWPSRSSSTRSTRAAARPPGSRVVGEELLGPTLIAFGTPEQQARFLPPIAAVEELWCQGYSEPGAGSDLAAVATTAAPGRRRVGDHRPEGVDVAGARGRLVLRAGPDRAGLARAARACPTCSSRCASRGSRSGRSGSSPAPRSSTRCSSTAPAPSAATWSARPATAGGSRWPRWRSSAAWPRSGQQVGFRRELDGWSTLARRTGAGDAIRCSATGWPGPGSAWRSCARTRCARWRGPPADRAPRPRC